MAQDAIPTQGQMDTLRGLIRCGVPLTGQQRDYLAKLLDALGAAALAQADVEVAYARLLAVVPR